MHFINHISSTATSQQQYNNNTANTLNAKYGSNRCAKYVRINIFCQWEINDMNFSIKFKTRSFFQIDKTVSIVLVELMDYKI